MNNQDDYITMTLTDRFFHQKPVGTLKITDNFAISIYKKPKWLHRIMYRFLLGWIYEEGDQDE